MKEPSIETDYPIGPEHWDVLKPTKTGKYSNVDLTGMRFGKWLVLGFELRSVCNGVRKAAAGIGTVIATVGQRNPSIRETFSKERQIAAGVPEVSI